MLRPIAQRAPASEAALQLGLLLKLLDRPDADQVLTRVADAQPSGAAALARSARALRALDVEIGTGRGRAVGNAPEHTDAVELGTAHRTVHRAGFGRRALPRCRLLRQQRRSEQQAEGSCTHQKVIRAPKRYTRPSGSNSSWLVAP